MGTTPDRAAGVTSAEHSDGTDASVDDVVSIEPDAPDAPDAPDDGDTTVVPAPPDAPVDRLTGARHRWFRLARRTWPVVIVVVILVVRAFIAEPLRVASVSMEPSLRAGQHVLVDKVSYRLHPPRRDDFIVFPQPGDGHLAVKRVVGLAGDTVALEDGVLVVNGVERREPYVDHRMIDSVYFGPEVVPDDMVFVMGDNRGSSIDSRSYGPVEVDTVVGRVLLRG